MVWRSDNGLAFRLWFGVQINIASAGAVDREFEYKCWLKFGGGGLRPPAPPCFPGAPPPGPPKRRSAPLAAAVVRFLATEPLVWAAALPGAELFLKKHLFLNKPLVRGSFAAWDRTFYQKSVVCFQQTTCPGQLRCLADIFLNIMCVFLF